MVEKLHSDVFGLDAQTQPKPKGWRRYIRGSEPMPVEVPLTKEALLAQETECSSLFLQTLEKMIASEKETLDLVTAFKDVCEYHTDAAPNHIPELLGSHVLMGHQAFTPTPLLYKQSTKLGPPETTTSYGFTFSSHKAPYSPIEYETARYVLDQRADETLQQFGVSKDQLTRISEGFYKMACLAEHDHLHQMMLRPILETVYRFPPLTEEEKNQRHPPLTHTERHALTLHAYTWQCLFQEVRQSKNPQGESMDVPIGKRRKQAVLRMGASMFKELADMQETALSHAHTPEERARVIEAATYYTEIYGHRFFRVIDPKDEDVTLMIPVELKKNSAVTSVAAECARIHLLMPQQMPTDTPHYASGIDALLTLCETFLPDVYTSIHTEHMTPLDRYVSGVRAGKTEAMEPIHCKQVLADIVRAGVPPMKEKWEALYRKTPSATSPTL